MADKTRSRKIREKRKHLGSLAILFIVLAVFAVSTIGGIRLRQRNRTYEAREQALEDEIGAEEERASEIEELEAYTKTKKYVEDVAKEYPEVTLEHMLVDNCAMQLVKDPAQFDVILTENMFGDILSDEASMVTGSIGMLASASLNETKFGLYEPSGGSAPDIAGKGIANPIATILSAAMMLRYSFDLDKEADAVESAVEAVLKAGYRTIDIMSEGKIQIGTKEMGDRICGYIK